MKIFLLTIHVGFNFGSSLQTIATVELLKRYDSDVTVLNYHPRRVTYSGYFTNMFSSFKCFIKSLFAFPNFVLNRRIYYSYLKKHLILSQRCYSKRQLQHVQWPENSVFITGSDQVWNFKYNEGIDSIYFWDFLPLDKYVISFSSSFGHENLNAVESETVKKLLKRFSFVSVRELSAKKFLTRIGVDAVCLFDPTLLLSQQEWKKYISPRKLADSYLLVYIPYNVLDKSVVYETARTIAAHKNLRIVTFSWNYFTQYEADKTFFYSNPSDFLSLVYYADYVITNSFHGTAFSINFNKQFWVFNPSGYTSRIDSLLNICGIENRKLYSNIEIEKINDMIDFDVINRILDVERKRAFAYLDSTLSR